MPQHDRVPTEPGEVAIAARNVTFDWADTPLHWMPDEPVASMVINAFNLLLPEGERMFCRTFNEALPLVRDEKLREEMIGFIGQESMHAETHNQVLEEVLRVHGIDIGPYQEQMEFLFRRLLGPDESANPIARHQRLLERLNVIAVLEHFFAWLGVWVLNADLERHRADPRMADLFRWHGAEEVEHRNVAHDVAAYFRIGYLRRTLPIVLAFPIFLLLMLRGAKFLIRQDPNLPNLGHFRLTVRILGAMWRGALPGVPSLLWGMLSMFNPWYSPSNMGSTAQAVAYLATSPATRRAA
ncbi:metal-dependent hydrolase [Nocardia sp. NBC_01503]|uniref:metal-dependent hydrolase n=1 Tax=Nocardia sp. NBC_01503 TaxID=2975997 RepID=UPI002E7C50B1|nr:metal-dependent hydrolase [Nocardia sp. NBC_01503]WTL30187.1 metal-dependent hydrolase [Nocardia sp. NBC_01503]